MKTLFTKSIRSLYRINLEEVFAYTRSAVVNASVKRVDWHRDGVSLECSPPLHEVSF